MNSETHKKLAPVLLAIVFTAAVSGYFMGLQQTSSALGGSGQAVNGAPTQTPAAQAASAVPRAASYGELAEARLKANSNWTNTLAMLVQPPLDLFAPVQTNPTLRLEAIQARAGRRAYDGAPPVVPHPVEQVAAASCLACHAQGLVVKDRIAPRVSHPHYTSCTQCHVPAGGIGLTANVEFDEFGMPNSFVGAQPISRGNRAGPYAPPTIPHPTWMRQDCNACHGPMGVHGLRTPHPWQVSCTQCHVPSALLDQRAYLTDPFPE